LRLDPTNQSGATVQIDWARLVSVDASLCRTISWTGGSGNVNIHLVDAGSNTDLGPIAVSVQATGQSASPGCSASGSGNSYTYYAGALAPGTYKVGVVTSGTALNLSTNVSSGTWVVNDIPTLGFITPSEEGGDDFATVELGNPWDMAALSDVDMFNFVNNRQIESIPLQTQGGVDLTSQTVLTGTSIAGPGAGFGDPQLGLLWNPGRGATTRIDPNKYRILTLEMGVQNLARSINDGAIARVLWRVAGNDACGESVSNDVIFTSRAGANVVNRLIMDLADRTTLPIEEGCPDGWVKGSSSTPGLDLFRVDPHEYTPATPFFIARVKLAAFERAGNSYNITWAFSDTGSGTVDLYYDNDGSGFDGTLIASNLSATPGSYTWNTTGVSAPSVFIYAVYRDDFAGGSNENRVYAKWPIVLENNAAPEVSVNRSRLNYGVANATTMTPSQRVLVNVTSGNPCWTVSNPAPSVFTVSPSSGTGNGSFDVSLAAASYPEGFSQDATLTVGPCSGSSLGNTATVALAVRSHISPTGPSGVLDTPADGVTVSGSIAVTGWAIDDVGLQHVAIWRDAAAGEPEGRKFVGFASRVDDSRTDIAALAPDVPFQYRAGWGYLLLTHFLPGQGDGTYRLHAYATDLEGNERLLDGSITIHAANSSSFTPFGAIDTPGQGETVSGTSVNNWGWVLVRGTARAHPPFGTVTVFIDGKAVGTPSGWRERTDIVSLFPESIYSGARNAVALFRFDSTAYANGVHTIFWIVRADNGLADGIGSRFFTIQNASAPLTTASADPWVIEAPAGAGGRSLGRRAYARPLDAATDVRARRVAGDGEAHLLLPGAGRSRIVVARSGQPIQLEVGPGRGSLEAYHVVDGRLAALPVGATFDDKTGVLAWLPGPGFANNHDFVFVREGREIAVRVVLEPRAGVRRAMTQPRAAFNRLFGSTSQ
jgi:hypothetical protein